MLLSRPDAGSSTNQFCRRKQAMNRRSFSAALVAAAAASVLSSRGIAQTPYTDKSVIRECFTLMAYLSAITSRIRFVPAVMGIPQRQTVLVAKQAAEIDIMSNGRFVCSYS